eukprot:scaffold207243_cov46-Attheya_sp.AAC.4
MKKRFFERDLWHGESGVAKCRIIVRNKMTVWTFATLWREFKLRLEEDWENFEAEAKYYSNLLEYIRTADVKQLLGGTRDTHTEIYTQIINTPANLFICKNGFARNATSWDHAESVAVVRYRRERRFQSSTRKSVLTLATISQSSSRAYPLYQARQP